MTIEMLEMVLNAIITIVAIVGVLIFYIRLFT